MKKVWTVVSYTRPRGEDRWKFYWVRVYDTDPKNDFENSEYQTYIIQEVVVHSPRKVNTGKI